MADKGWISKHALQNDALSADTEGRSAVEDGFLTNAKIAADQITASKLASGKVLVAGVYGVSTYGYCYYA